MKGHLEIEAKYDVTDEQPLPDLVGVGAVVAVEAQPEMTLTATYFDTADHALGAAAVTLRRRTGGQDDGWHLKLSVAHGERLELHRDLEPHRDLAGVEPLSPPLELTSVVRAIVRTSALVPVAELVTRRTAHRLLGDDGRVLAELADDRVTGRRHDISTPDLTWREVEIELVEGGRDLLAALDSATQAAGISPAASSSKVGRVLAVSRAAPSVVGDLVAADPLVRLDRAGGAAALRTALQAVTASLGHDGSTDALRADLGWVDQLVARLDDPAVARTTALADVRAALDSSRYLNLLESLTGQPAH